MLYFYIKTWMSCLFTVSLLLLSIHLFSQQTSFQSNQAFYPQLYNPAALGEGQIAISYRQQWVGFEGKTSPRSFLLYSDFSSLFPFRDKIGIGFTLQSNKAHIFTRTNINLSFAYHLLNQKKHRFSIGVVAGILNQRLDLSDLQLSSLNELELYNGSSNQLTFDGGPGVFYQFKNEKNQFSFNFTLPQLFTSDLTFEQDINPKYDNQLHFIAGIQYRKKIAKFALEPSILYRAANAKDKAFAKNTTDLNLSVFFLDNLFWINGGVRLNGNTFMGGAGLRIAKKMDLAGIYEFHNELGASYEMTAIYHFNTPKSGPITNPNPDTNLDPNPNSAPNPAPNMTSVYLKQLSSEKEKLKIAKANQTSSKYAELKKNLKYANKSFLQSKFKGISKEEIKVKLENSEEYLAIAKTEMDKILYDVQPNYLSLQSANRIFETAQKGGKKYRSISKEHNAILELSEEINLEVAQNRQEYLDLNSQIQAYKLQKRINPTYVAVFKKDKVNEISQRLNDELDKIPGLGKNAEVNVKINASNRVEINYKIPYIGNSYVLGKELSPQKNMMDHISEQLEQFQKGNIRIAEIQIEMLLQDELNEMKKNNSTFPYYGEFGLVAIKSTLADKENKKEEKYAVQINKWQEISITELASLKLFGTKKYLKENGLKNYFLTSFRISGPNYDEDNWQTLQIKIIIKE